jgi:hypothetical protein
MQSTITSSIWRRIRTGIVGLEAAELSTHTPFERNRVVPTTWRPGVGQSMLCVGAAEIEGERPGRTALTLAA